MRRLLTSLVTVVSVVLTVQVADASHPEFLQHFEIVPRVSTLRVTGGFAGVDERYRLIGDYDLHYGFHPGTGASFENAEVWGSLISDLPTPAVVIDVDEILNLESLKGEILPVAAPFDVFRFTGQTADGSDLTLLAAKLGPWMYLRGHSRPPEGGSDFFNYHVRWLARSGPSADFNDDGMVDAADYTLLRDSLGIQPSLDGAGWAEWRDQFGQRIPDIDALDATMDTAMASLGVSAAAVPEPSAVVLVVAGLLVVFRCKASGRR